MAVRGAGDRRREQGVLDTNAVIYMRRLPPDDLPRKPLTTTVTLAELSVGPLTATSEADAAERQSHLQAAEADFDPLPFDLDAARAFGRVSASLRRAGKKPQSRTYDTMIAAIAVSNGLPLYTCNPRDFEGIDGLELIPVSIPVKD
jgi:tRNA(fMet)-specific endonuclease VapC